MSLALHELVLSFVEGEMTPASDIAAALGYSNTTVLRTLRRWAQLGKCRVWLHKWENGKRSWVAVRT